MEYLLLVYQVTKAILYLEDHVVQQIYLLLEQWYTNQAVSIIYSKYELFDGCI